MSFPVTEYWWYTYERTLACRCIYMRIITSS